MAAYLTHRPERPSYAHFMARRADREIETEEITDVPTPDDLRGASTRARVGTQEDRDEEAAEGAEPYFPPTDPVVNGGGRAVVGGLERTSMDSLEVDPSTIDEEPGDEALADAVRRELHEDAETSHLHLDVQVRRGVVFLRGIADDIEDTDNAADVASRLPGVRQVVEQIGTPRA